MCVVTQTVERVAREVREEAMRLDNEATRVAVLDVLIAPRRTTVDDITTKLRAAAARLRASAKLLDGKD